MARRRYAAIATVVIDGKRYAPGAGFSADSEHDDVKRQLASQAMRCLDSDDTPARAQPPRGRHKRRDMRPQA